MSAPEFIAFPKIPRLNRPVIVTEKIDGTNACVVIEQGLATDPKTAVNVCHDGVAFHVYAQSRKRIIVPGADNFGFAAWVHANADDLVFHLGEGRHFGEWWGKGIQRGYGLEDRRFSLFNTHVWGWLANPKDELEHIAAKQMAEIGVHVVPVLGTLQSLADGENLAVILDWLQGGSVAAPGYDRPEGVVLFHLASQQIYKVLLENDDVPKGLAS